MRGWVGVGAPGILCRIICGLGCHMLFAGVSLGGRPRSRGLMRTSEENNSLDQHNPAWVGRTIVVFVVLKSLFWTS